MDKEKAQPIHLLEQLDLLPNGHQVQAFVEAIHVHAAPGAAGVKYHGVLVRSVFNGPGAPPPTSGGEEPTP